MWFKNLRVYRITSDIDVSVDTLEAKLGDMAFSPCTNVDFSKYGWVSPLGKSSEMYTHAIGNNIMICARKQEKILPTAAINEVVEEKVEELETREARSAYRKERKNIKEDVIHTLLPRALTRSSLSFAYIDTKKGLIILDTASANKAEELLDYLRASLGQLPVVPLKCHGDAADVMTRWLSNHPPKGFELDNECELQNSRESKNIIRCRNQELESEEVMTHLKAGKRVIQMAICWRDAIRFVLTDDFSIKRLRFEEVIQEQADDGAEDAATQFDQDFAIMSLQINQLLEELFAEFGGLEKQSK